MNLVLLTAEVVQGGIYMHWCSVTVTNPAKWLCHAFQLFFFLHKHETLIRKHRHMCDFVVEVGKVKLQMVDTTEGLSWPEGGQTHACEGIPTFHHQFAPIFTLVLLST